MSQAEVWIVLVLSPRSRLCVWASVTSVSMLMCLSFCVCTRVCVFVSLFVCLCLCLFSAADEGFAFVHFFFNFIFKNRKKVKD